MDAEGAIFMFVYYVGQFMLVPWKSKHREVTLQEIKGKEERVIRHRELQLHKIKGTARERE